MRLRRLAPLVVLPAMLAGVACGGNDAPADGASFEQDPAATEVIDPDATSETADLEPLISTSNPSAFSIIEDDLSNAWTTDEEHTFVRGPDDYQAFGFFDTPEEAQAALAEWEYQGGYITGFNPVGLTAAVLRGDFYIDLELHLFKTIDQAAQAFEHFVDYRGSAEGAEAVSLAPVGNEHGAFVLVSGTVPGSDIAAAYHLYIFRRGNLVVVTQTRGADPYMTGDSVVALARIVDEKVLGTRTSPSPTPGELVPVPATLTPEP